VRRLMRLRWISLVPVVSLVPVIGLLGCRGVVFDTFRHLTPEKRAATEKSVRQFAASVAHDVSQDGPIAWQKHFSQSPSFFMAVNGKVAFPSGQAAAQALPEVARMYKHIELHWGNDLRVDVLATDLAVLGASYEELLDESDGHRTMSNGYFTGVTELLNGQWQFRDIHWSEPVRR
jgi:hypothetical protein